MLVRARQSSKILRHLRLGSQPLLGPAGGVQQQLPQTSTSLERCFDGVSSSADLDSTHTPVQGKAPRSQFVAPWFLARNSFSTSMEDKVEQAPLSSPSSQRLFQNSKPRSLKTENPYIQVEVNDDTFLGRFVLQLGGYYSKESSLVQGSNSLLKMVLEHSESSGIREALHLKDDFRTKHAFLCLHVWMILRRLRKSGPDGKKVSQLFYDNFQHDVEMSVHREGVRVRVNKWLRQLEDIFFGAAQSYDSAIDKQTEDFADVLYRNVYAEKGDKNYSNALARYTLRELASLSLTDTESVLKGSVKFNSSTD